MTSRRPKPFPIATLAAGGIVLSQHRPPRIAVVQRRKDDCWVLPKGKLKPRESLRAAARREVTEETGHPVRVHEFLGAVSYESGSKPKVAHFWRMVSTGNVRGEPMKDVKAVEWLSLPGAIARLSLPLERAFLMQIGQRVVGQARRSRPRRAAPPPKSLGALKGHPEQSPAIPLFAKPNLIGRLLRRLRNTAATGTGLG